MTRSQSSDSTSGRLEVHCFSSSKGESIALKLPNGNWGLVDCYASSIIDDESNSALQFLREQGVSQLEFLCLTHAHDDHYRGMSRVIRQLDPKAFWCPAAMTPERLKLLLKAETVDAAKGGSPEAIENVSELEQIFLLVGERRQLRRSEFLIKCATAETHLYPIPPDEGSELKISAIAPSGNQIHRFEAKLKNCFTSDGKLKEQLPHATHNIVSIALLVRFGRTTVILGGDVEKSGWSDAMREAGPQNLSAAAVKVSHHGSGNGYCDQLWSSFASERKPIAVVTPFRSRRLPRRVALEHISEHTAGLFTTCLPAIDVDELPVPLSPRAPVKSREAIRRAFAAFLDVDIGCGRCSLVFNSDGDCTDLDLCPPAAEIPFARDFE